MKRMLSLVLAAVLLLSLTACGKQEPDRREAAPAPVETQAALPETQTPEATAEPAAPATEGTLPPMEETLPPTTQAPELVDGMHPEFKQAMDDYEAFIDEYVAFMTDYAEKEADAAMLLRYAEFLGKYADFASSFEAWEDEDLNNTELSYYIQVQARVSQKLLTAAAALPQ